MAGSQPEQERRREHRHRVLKGAAILRSINQSVINCTVRNMHDNGAELRVPAEVYIPASFLLYIPVDAVAYRSTVRWRSGTRMGVEFTGAERKPHWYYG